MTVRKHACGSHILDEFICIVIPQSWRPCQISIQITLPGIQLCITYVLVYFWYYTESRDFQVMEPRFGAELFASILSIPGSKTLLRRHLTTHFVSLVGNEVQHRKRDLEASPGYVPLTPNQKVKVSARTSKVIHLVSEWWNMREALWS